MTIRVAVRHHTRYRYERPVALGPHTLRVRPAPHTRTPIEAYSLVVEPDDHFINWQQDPYSNHLARLVFPEKTRELSVAVEIIARMVAVNPFDFFLEESASDCPFEYDSDVLRDLKPYLEVTDHGPLLKKWLSGVTRKATPTIDFLVALNQRLAEDIEYVVRLEPGVQTPEETLRQARGSCRDSAWLLVQIARHLGLASRFVSGYLVQLTADQKALDGPSGPSADFSDLHAWTEVYLPGAGWVGLDPTSGLFAAEGHIPLAATPHYRQAAAIDGKAELAACEFDYSNTVARIAEDPRVTRPYDDATWRAINAAGRDVDARLARADVRLTQGGEPTFVGIDNVDLPEWNTAADGAHKRERAAALARRLYHRCAPQGVLHNGFGKWYPGEPLPRWALNVFWRADDEALWGNPEWLAALSGAAGKVEKSTARTFAEALAERLGLPHANVHDAFEDTLYYVWREGNLPIDVDPRDPRLDDPLERARLRRLLSGELNQPAGSVLPLRRDYDGRWRSGAWPLRREQLFLLPGDSPLGLRLPLDALPKASAEETIIETDPMAPRDPLPPRGYVRPPGQYLAPQSARNADDAVVRTALTTEVRDGQVHVFLPPVERLEDYVALLEAVEGACTDLAQPVVLEGYEPPGDPRMRLIQVTPDPGVIEVNVAPASSWDELVDSTDALYEDARQCRLQTEKFMLDGRHSGTGGGNHVTLGGTTPSDSPFLRRPDLLKSLITLWQNHPSLSYLFSGLFIGPTSQAPRIDEAREDALSELETALAGIPAHSTDVPPWLVDRMLRHHMVDLTGNTHRAEICIDKLYSPDQATGRRGLVEFRAFEMPPHERMSHAQMLLMRALVTRCWEAPVERPLIRWGTQLHDRFMLPWFIWHDFRDVIDDLQQHDFALDPSWYDAFRDFRFPKFGAIDSDGMSMTLRGALEPWHVLGEESGAGGTARYVDSSVERLEVAISGFVPERYAVTCNGYPVPLQPTGVEAQYVGGVRFKAWSPPSGMHPAIPAHGPLVFNLVDRRQQRVLAGCRYHVAHPGGRSHENFPVNARSAEARRLERFEPHGHDQGEFQWRDPALSPDMPFTLDLRRCR